MPAGGELDAEEDSETAVIGDGDMDPDDEAEAEVQFCSIFCLKSVCIFSPVDSSASLLFSWHIVSAWKQIVDFYATSHLFLFLPHCLPLCVFLSLSLSVWILFILVPNLRWSDR